MRKNVVKKVTAVSLAATLAFGSLISAFADLGVTNVSDTAADTSVATSAPTDAPVVNPVDPTETPTTTPTETPTTTPTETPTAPEDIIYENGVVVDGSAGWNSTGGGINAIYDGYYTNVYFENTPFIRDANNYSNFVIETNAVNGTKGLTVRADAWGWLYGEGSEPTFTVTTTWGDDWAKFVRISGGDVIASVYKQDANTLVITIQFDSGDKEVYTVTYPDGIPADLGFFVGADGGKVTLNKVTFTEELPTMEVTSPDPGAPTTTPDTTPTTKPGDTTTTTTPGDTATTTPGTTDKTPVAGDKTSTTVVAAKKITISKVKGYTSTKSFNLVKGRKVTLTTSVSPAKADQTILAKSSKNKVATATVKANKVTIKAKKAGKATITITSKANSAVKATVKINVSKKAVKAKKVTVKKAKLTIKRGKSATIAIKKIKPATTTDKVTFVLAKKVKGVSVDKFGKVKVTKKAKKGATAKVTVKVGKKAKTTVTIKVK